ncbi:MAG: hypothetical protein LBD52_06280 [Prevotellaceae bacterium]|jgi:hypothetical protein|nr:hypothetical protein [Prevotellaceae bacterium]
MKTTMSKQILFFAALGCTVAPVAAQTIDVYVCGSYTINNTVTASSGTATVTYRWLENGRVIPGANSSSYTILEDKSEGIYTYIRQATTASCSDWESSNAFTVAVKGIKIGDLTWALCDVGMPGSFTASPFMDGYLYQWDNKTPWPATGEVENWNTTPSINSSWLPENSPCPTNWRIPTGNEWAQLVYSNPDDYTGVLRYFYQDGWWIGPGYETPYTPGSIHIHRTSLMTSEGVLWKSGRNARRAGSGSPDENLILYHTGMTIGGDASVAAMSVRCVRD